jgi:outer membrane protein OmpA-like peptidoglycan-associated protein
VAFRPPADDGGSPITGYRISLDGGLTWKTLNASGSGVLTGKVTPVTNGALYHVVIQVVNRDGRDAQTPVRMVRAATWFHDPLNAATRRGELPVPSKPANYRGPLVHTRATNRSFDGTPAMDVSAIHGRQLQAGEAAALGDKGFFAFDSAVLTSQGKKLVAELAASLRYDKAITCEGYADYGGHVSHEEALSVARAKAVCTLLKADGVRVVFTTIGYGALDPVVVGGVPADRQANRRVVVVVTR